MNCAECRENLVAWLEDALETGHAGECQAHVNECAACRAEHEALVELQQQLTGRAVTAREVSLVGPVMRQVRNVQAEKERSSVMSRLLMRWGLGLGAAAATMVAMVLLVSPGAHATAVEVMTRGARAVGKLTSVHLRGRVRTTSAENFGAILPDHDFTPIELWKQFAPDLKWRVEKEQRVALMDGETTLMYLKPLNLAVKLQAKADSAFDTDWLQRIAKLSDTITNEIVNAREKGWKLGLTETTGADGRKKDVVTVEAKAGLPDNDYLKNKTFDSADTRRVYTFDDRSELLEGVQVYLKTSNGEVEVFALTQIDCNQPIDEAVFHLELPANVNWNQEAQALPDNAKYAAMTAEQAARAFFEACGSSNWTEVAKFAPMPVTMEMREVVAGLKIVSLGDSFTSQQYPGRFVPYEIRLKNGQDVTNNLALRRDNPGRRWMFDGGL